MESFDSEISRLRSMIEIEQGFSVALLSLGVVLLLLGLLGTMKFKDIELGTKSLLVRVFVVLLGLSFIAVALASTGLLQFPASRISKAAAWAGSWHQTFVGAAGGNFVGRMELRAIDDVRVVGDFESQINRRRYTGTLQGDALERRLAGSWSNEYGQRGLFDLELSPDGGSFRGTYSMGIESPNSRPGNIWSGTKDVPR